VSNPSFSDLCVPEKSAPYVIAEIGVNHEGSLETAKRLIELANEGGANCAKFQTYKAETLASRNSPAYWDTSKEISQSQFSLFKRYDVFGPEEYRILALHCNKVGIDFMSTPFDLNAVEFLDPLVNCFKIASADLTNVPLLRAVAERGKPVILSTGASNTDEIDLAIDELEANGCHEICLLHCILNYPTPDQNANLSMITGLRGSYPDRVIGYSDHTVPDESMTALTTAFLLGARVIEKHFTHDKSLPGNDHYHAMDVNDMRRLIEKLEQVQILLGFSDCKTSIPSEDLARKHARRSIVLTRAMSANDSLKEDDLTVKRPGSGISPLHWDEVIGRTIVKDLKEDTILCWEHLASEDSK